MTWSPPWRSPNPLPYPRDQRHYPSTRGTIDPTHQNENCWEIARRHDISPQHLFAWRKAARSGLLSLPAAAAPLFVPVVTELRGEGGMRGADSPGVITIEIGGAVVRAARGVDPAWLRDVLRAVKAAT
jgi:transposase